jgi:nitrogen fixation/metabolism regulation signal transduction histidine kinase
MTLRGRLLAALLVFALLPTLVLTLFTLSLLGSATERWFLPGVDRALGSAVGVTRAPLARLEATVLDRADDWAAGLRDLPLDGAGRALLRDAVHGSGLDFAQGYARVDGQWRLVETVSAAGTTVADTLDLAQSLEAALTGSRLVRDDRGALAGVSLALSGEHAMAAGVRVPQGFFTALEDVARAREYYPRLAVLVDVQRQWVWLLMGGLAVLFAALALIVARALASGLTQPLRALASGFERVADGDLAARVPESGAQELRSLAASFNRMTERLASARTQLAAAEREAAWREVARRLAHEIKNPLTPMRLSLHRLQRRVGLVPDDQRAAVADSLEALLHEVEHLTRLAGQFSQYARLPDPRREAADLAALARDAVALHEPEDRTLAAEALDPAPVVGDRLLLSRALHNLLLNACEASPAGGRIEVRTGTAAGRAWAEVLDRGPGVPAELRDQVFEPYISTKNRGSGLGLSLVRDIAAQHGGTATLAARDGGGSVARLEFPIAGHARPGEDQ